jgi:signal transduction histidine kinase
MRFNGSLITRFLLATSVLVVVLCTVFALAVYQFIELLEDEMLNRMLVREMQELKLQVAAEPNRTLPAYGGLSAYIVRDQHDRARLPQELAGLSRGVHEDVLVGGHVYYVAVDDVGQSRLYLLLDTARVDNLERSVLTVSMLVGLLALGLAAIVGWVLARAVMRPVTALASQVARLDPSRKGTHLAGQFASREVRLIAAAFDGYIERLDKVREREQAFTEDASHELRTPLAIVSSAAELLTEEAQLSDSGRERVVRIQRAATQMQSLIEALLFLARGESDAPPQQCSLDRIVEEAVELISASATARSLKVLVEMVPVTISGSPAMVACVVNNLLLNAVNFTQDGMIRIRLTSDTLTVADTGVGIPPQDLSRIFERHYRGSHSRGLGLGLHLVNRICERLGWTIETESTAGIGTTFRILLRAAVRPSMAEIEGV